MTTPDAPVESVIHTNGLWWQGTGESPKHWSVPPTLAQLREAREFGFERRDAAWLDLLTGRSKTATKQTEESYKNKLDQAQNSCQGCMRLMPEHIPMFCAPQLECRLVEAEREEGDGDVTPAGRTASSLDSSLQYDETWAEMARTHELDESKISSAKRILLVLFARFPLDYCGSLPDLVCFLLQYIDGEAKVYSAALAALEASNACKGTLWRMASAHERRPPKLPTFFVHTDRALFRASICTFFDVVQSRFGAKLRRRIEPTTSEFFGLLFTRFFLPILHLAHSVRIFELVLSEGWTKVMFRYGLALIEAFRDVFEEALGDVHEMVADFRGRILLSPSSSGAICSSNRLASLALCGGSVPSQEEGDSNSQSLLAFPDLSRLAFKRKFALSTKKLFDVDTAHDARIRRTAHTPRAVHPPHVSMGVFSESTTIKCFEDAERLARWLPDEDRPKFKSLFLAYSSLVHGGGVEEVYKQSFGFKDRIDASILLIRARLVEVTPELSSRTLLKGPDRKRPPTVVFGAYIPGILVPRRSREDLHDDRIFLFRLTPNEASQRWRVVASRVPGGLGTPRSGNAPYVHFGNDSMWIGAVSRLMMRDLKASAEFPRVSQSSRFQIEAFRSMEKVLDNDDDEEEEKTNTSNEAPSRVQTAELECERPSVVLIGPGLYIDKAMTHGHSGYSSTFQNDPLCTMQKNSGSSANKGLHDYFQIDVVEVFAVPKFQ